MNLALRVSVALASLAAGFAAGALWRRETAETAPVPAPASVPAAAAGVVTAPPTGSAPADTPPPLRPDPTPSGPPVETLRARAAEERARIAEAVAAEDGRALLRIFRRLVALGEPGYEGAIEVLALLVDAASQDPPGLGLLGSEVSSILGSPDLAGFEAWVLGDASRAPAAVRASVAAAWCWQPDVDALPLALSRLAVETDEGVVRALTQAGYLLGPENLAATAEAIRAQSSRPFVGLSLIMFMGRRCGDEAWPTLQTFLDDPNPEVASEALIWSEIVRPPVAGAVFVGMPPGAGLPLQRGDIVVSWEGRTVENAAQVAEQFEKWPEGGRVNVVVRRGDSLVPLLLEKKPAWLGTRSTAGRK